MCIYIYILFSTTNVILNPIKGVPWSSKICLLLFVTNLLEESKRMDSDRCNSETNIFAFSSILQINSKTLYKKKKGKEEGNSIHLLLVAEER